MSMPNKHRTATIDAMAHRERLRFDVAICKQKLSGMNRTPQYITEQLMYSFKEHLKVVMSTAISAHELAVAIRRLNNARV